MIDRRATRRLLLVAALALAGLTAVGENEPAPCPTAVGEIAFPSDREGTTSIYVINADGTGLRHVTSSDWNDLEPSRSPDGARIAFHSNVDGSFDAYVMDRGGGNPIRITQSEPRGFLASWSPDGEWIAFVSGRNGQNDIYRMRPDGSDMYPTWRPLRDQTGEDVGNP